MHSRGAPPLTGEVYRWVFRLAWLTLLSGSGHWLELSASPSNLFVLGEDRPVRLILLWILHRMAVLITGCIWTWGAYQRSKAQVHGHARAWLSVLLLWLVGAVFALRPWAQEPPNPITPAAERDYLVFAAHAREALSANADKWLSLDPSDTRHPSGTSHFFQQRLEPLVPSYWPRRWLFVELDGACVVLARGNGSIGQVGVRIYDQAPPTKPSGEASSSNPYLPRETFITDRLAFYYSN